MPVISMDATVLVFSIAKFPLHLFIQNTVIVALEVDYPVWIALAPTQSAIGNGLVTESFILVALSCAASSLEYALWSSKHHLR